MSSVQESKQDRNEYRPSYEVQGQVLPAVNETDVSINLFVRLLTITSVAVIPFTLLVLWFDPPYDMSMTVLLMLVTVVLGSFSWYLFLVALRLPEWFRYRRLMKEGVLTEGVINDYVELSDLETTVPIPHIVYSFAEGHPTLQKVDRPYKLETKIVVRYVPNRPSLSRAELST